MKRMIFVACIALLTGCASMVGNGPIAMARRTRYLQAHPNDPYASNILAGHIVVGMSLDDVDAMWGSQCSLYQTSSYGTTYTCQTNMLADQYAPGMMVLFDSTDHVMSWVN